MVRVHVIKGICLLFIFISMLLSNQSLAQVFKCITDNGLEYQNTPCYGEGKKINIKTNLVSHKPVVNKSSITDKAETNKTCDPSLYGTWKASWFQHGKDGKRLSTQGVLKWTFRRNHTAEFYTDGQLGGKALKVSYQCTDHRITIFTLKNPESKNDLLVHSVNNSELVTIERSKLVHWRKM